jgi:hypothetical protein
VLAPMTSKAPAPFAGWTHTEVDFTIRYQITMLWFFEKDGDRLQCEIRPSTQDAGFELEWQAKGQVHVEQSEKRDTLAQRWFELELQWKRDGWIKLDDVAPSRPKR